MTKLTSKERRERKKHKKEQTNNLQKDNDNDDSNDTKDDGQHKENPEFTPEALANINSWINSEKRTITFNGIAPFEVMNRKDDILYFEGFTGCFISIIATARTCQDLEMSYLFEWVKEKKPVMVLKLNANNDVVCFAVLHEVDFEPFRKHKKPFVMDYIYTYEQYRDTGHAQSLINAIKTKYQFTAFCNSELSELVFEKCNLNLMRTRNCQMNGVIARTK